MAYGFIAAMSDGSTLICFQLSVHVISPLEVLNGAVQSRKASLSDILLAMQMTCSNLQSMRTNVEFNKLFSETQKMCSDLNISKPQLPRQRRPPSRYSGEGDCHKWNSAEEFFRSHYFALIDAAVNGLRSRYTRPGLQRCINLEKVLTSKDAAADELPLDIVSATASYPELCAESLSTQLRMFEQQGF